MLNLYSTGFHADSGAMAMPNHKWARAFASMGLLDGADKFKDVERFIRQLDGNEFKGHAFEVFSEALLATAADFVFVKDQRKDEFEPINTLAESYVQMNKIEREYPYLSAIKMSNKSCRDKGKMVGFDGYGYFIIKEMGAIDNKDLGFVPYQSKYTSGGVPNLDSFMNSVKKLFNMDEERGFSRYPMLIATCNEEAVKRVMGDIAVDDRRKVLIVGKETLDSLPSEAFQAMRGFIAGTLDLKYGDNIMDGENGLPARVWYTDPAKPFAPPPVPSQTAEVEYMLAKLQEQRRHELAVSTYAAGR